MLAFHFGLSVDMTDTMADTMAAKLFMGLLPITEPSASEGWNAVTINRKYFVVKIFRTAWLVRKHMKIHAQY